MTVRVGLRGGLPRRRWGDAPRGSLARARGVVDVVELIDLGLAVAQAIRRAVACPSTGTRSGGSIHFTLGGRLVRLAGDRVHPEDAGVGDEPAVVPASRWVQRRCVVR